MDPVVIGSRGSRLAQLMVAEYLSGLGACPVVRFITRIVVTDGDKDRKSLVSEVSDGGQGAFTSQLERELAIRRIDVAVHSLKDLPTAIPAHLALATTPVRGDARDALCGSTLAGLRPGARVGTGSPKRTAQLKAVRPDLDVVPIRGNVPTRLAKLKTGGLDAVVLAAAGLQRLGLDACITELLPLEQFPPSPGQGAMAIQVRAEDTELLEMLSSYGDPVSDAEVTAERALLAGLHGGCSVPVGGYAAMTGDGLRLTGQVTSLDGTRQVAGSATAAAGTSPQQLGQDLAQLLLDRGAAAILSEIRAPV